MNNKELDGDVIERITGRINKMNKVGRVIKRERRKN